MKAVHLRKGKKNPCDQIQNKEKTIDVNPDRKPRVKPQSELTVNTDNILATPAAKLPPNVMLYIPLNLVGTSEKRACRLGSAWLQYTITRACRGHSCFTTKMTEF